MKSINGSAYEILVLIAYVLLDWHQQLYCRAGGIFCHWLYDHSLLVQEMSTKISFTGSYINSNKKDTSGFHCTVYFDPVKMLQQKISLNIY